MDITGVIQKVRYTNDKGIAIFEMAVDGGNVAVCTGTTPVAVVPGLSMRAEGAWYTHPRYGEQFKFHALHSLFTSREAGIVAFLQQHVEGVGWKLANRLLETFGGELGATIEEGTAEELMQVEGITATKAERIYEVWHEREQDREGQIALYDLGLTQSQANKSQLEWGLGAAKILKANLYRLVELSGLGFLTADKIARANGIQPNDTNRLHAGVEYVADQTELRGHCYLPWDIFLDEAQKILKITSEDLTKFLHEHLPSTALVCKHQRVYSKELYDKERYCEEVVQHFINDYGMNIYCDTQGLSPGQQDALACVMSHGLSIITGLPGTGKTTLIKRFVDALQAESSGYRPHLCAPTGKAAKRLAEVTGFEAKTIHRLLGYDGNGFKVKRLDPGIVIIDEMSMVDIRLFYALLQRINPATHRVVLVGDPYQLPSVGPGQVLRDLLRHAEIPRVQLTDVFRQQQYSPVLTLAHTIHAGDTRIIPPSTNPEDSSEVFSVKLRRTAESAVEAVMQAIADEQPDFFPQVLVPFKSRGLLSANHLNTAIQAQHNAQGVKHPQFDFRRGDPVIQMRNDYDIHVFNGEIGTVVEFDGKTMIVAFEERRIPYTMEVARSDLALAYALTIHKSQGSEFESVVLVMSDMHSVLLRRELLYTAVTRAKKRLTLVTTPSAYARAVENEEQEQRWTGLFR